MKLSKCSTSSTVSVPLIPIGESSQRATVFTIKLPWGQALSPVFTNYDIIIGLVYEHMTIEPVILQKLDEKNSLLVFTESEDIEKMSYIVIHCDVVGSRCKYWMQCCHTLTGVNGGLIISGEEKRNCVSQRQKHTHYLGKCQSHNIIFPVPVWPPT